MENAEQSLTEFSSASTRADRAPRSFSWLARNGTWGAVAAALAVAAGIGLWHSGRSPENASPGDDALISALQSLDLKSEDFAIVAQLGEVLEAELTADNALWPEPK